ncbi:TPA: hypothetical protein WD502_001477, partial [Neisseria meningitidis]
MPSEAFSGFRRHLFGGAGCSGTGILPDAPPRRGTAVSVPRVLPLWMVAFRLEEENHCRDDGNHAVNRHRDNGFLDNRTFG